MGFKFKKFSYVGNVGTWGANSTPRSRSEVVLKDMADWLITSGTGWALDTTRNATTSDFVEVPYWNPSNNSSYASSYNAPALFFTNATSGCKLFLCVQGNMTGDGFAPKIPQTEVAISSYKAYGGSGYESCMGIMMSMIPGDSADTFGSVFDGETPFIPTTATKLRGTVHGYGYFYGSSYKTSYIYNNSSNLNYVYGLYANPHVIGINGVYTSNGTTPVLDGQNGFFCGRIIGTLAHEESTPQAKYGVIQFGGCGYSQNEEFHYRTVRQIRTGANEPYFHSTQQFVNSLGSDRDNSSLQIFAANGSPIQYVGNVCNIRFYPANIQELSSYMSTSVTSGLSRWTPYAVGVCSTDLNTYGVVSGDGFKGYLDTDLFRAAADHTAGRLYNNGQFIGQWDMLLGWDPNNESI